ncbi:hypothetical protein EB169_01225 [archaeon]|nr:hypothetical protein [archaeon]NDB54438.1 hypothetical protein [archaeon]
MANNLDIDFCTYNTGTTVTPSNGQSVYLTAATASFSGSFGTVTLGSNQTLNPCVPIKFDSVVSGSARTLFYYLD